LFSGDRLQVVVVVEEDGVAPFLDACCSCSLARAAASESSGRI
jgi:hypothetical protein